jgi:hypothetical protein
MKNQGHGEFRLLLIAVIIAVGAIIYRAFPDGWQRDGLLLAWLLLFFMVKKVGRSVEDDQS